MLSRVRARTQSSSPDAASSSSPASASVRARVRACVRVRVCERVSVWPWPRGACRHLSEPAAELIQRLRAAATDSRRRR